MAVNLSSKPAAAIQLFSWEPALADGDAVASYILTPTTVVIEDDALNGNSIDMYISGGVAGNVYAIAATVETQNGETLKETLYLPVYGPGNAFANTGTDIISFALRPIVGIVGSPSTGETTDALEWLNGMLAEWKEQGADTGVALPLTTSSVIYSRDAWIKAIKTNLRVLVAEQYGRQVAPATAMAAARGLQLIKAANLPDDRGSADYF